MNRNYFFWLALVFFVLMSFPLFAQFAGGSGTEQDPYQVATAEHLNNVRNFAGSQFIQTADINLGVAPWNQDQGWSPLPLSGVYNGDGHQITGLFINRPSTNYQALFGRPGGATIKNLAVVDVNITGGSYVGAIAGQTYNGGTSIQKCSSSGQISGGHCIGGIIGWLDWSASLSNSFSTASVSGTNSIGGLVGILYSGSIVNCYSKGPVSGSESPGGLVGGYSGGSCSGSYWDTQTSGQANSARGIGRNTDAMTYPYAADTYVGWDFASTWNADTSHYINSGYPYLFSNYIFSPPQANNPQPPDLSSSISVDTNLAWEIDTNVPETSPPSGYRLSLGYDNPPTNILSNFDVGNNLSYQPVNQLMSNTTYYWQVVPYNPIGEAQDCPVWSFTTELFPPTISANPAALTYGSVEINSTVSKPILIKNLGDETLEVYSISSSNPRFGVTLPNGLSYPLNINARDSLQLSITFTPLAQQSYSGNIVFVSNDPTNGVLIRQTTGSGYILTPLFSATPLEGDVPLLVQFTNQTSGTISSWLWNFGDGEYSSEQHPHHTYSLPGLFTVSLTANDGYQEKTYISSDYINVVAHPIIAVSDSTAMSFGTVYLGDSGFLARQLQSIGTGTIEISDITTYSQNSPFSVDPSGISIAILPGDALEISIEFHPLQASSFSDTLYIHNNSENMPLIKIALRGIGEYVPPQEPQGVALVIDGYDAVITWEPVTQNIYNTPITVPYYFIYGAVVPDPDYSQQVFLGYSTETTFRHLGVGLPGSNVQSPREFFYTVTAVVWYPPRVGSILLDDLIGSSREEVAHKLFN